MVLGQGFQPKHQPPFHIGCEGGALDKGVSGNTPSVEPPPTARNGQSEAHLHHRQHPQSVINSQQSESVNGAGYNDHISSLPAQKDAAHLQAIPEGTHQGCDYPRPAPSRFICPDFCTEDEIAAMRMHPRPNVCHHRAPNRWVSDGIDKPATDRRAPDSCCYEYREPARDSCDTFVWEHGVHRADECGSGKVPKVCETRSSWCNTPLTVYQSTMCELGRRLLCGETKMPRRRRAIPPCSVCEDLIPMCGGYYRKCRYVASCDKALSVCRGGEKNYRRESDMYWKPCDDPFKHEYLPNIRKFAAHNAYLGRVMQDRLRIQDSVASTKENKN